jgi:hypothetical protein
MDENEPREQPEGEHSDIWGINLGEYDDPTNPPPGFKAIECPSCSEFGPKRAERKLAIGPIPGVGVTPGSARSFCPRCRGRTWIWWRIGREVV